MAIQENAVKEPLDQEISSLHDELNDNLTKQLAYMQKQLNQDIETALNQTFPRHRSPWEHHTNLLIHSITDNKIHRLNLELRQHIGYKVDGLMANIESQHKKNQQELLQKLDQRLNSHQHNANSRPWTFCLGLDEKLLLIIVACIGLGMMVYWPI